MLLGGGRKPEPFELGTAIKTLTSAVGITPCRSCEERAAKLNEWSRRGFIGNLSLLIFSTQLKFWRAVGPKADTSDALRSTGG